MFLVNSLFLGHTSPWSGLTPGSKFRISPRPLGTIWGVEDRTQMGHMQSKHLINCTAFLYYEDRRKYNCIIEVNLYKIANTLICGENLRSIFFKTRDNIESVGIPTEFRIKGFAWAL